MKIRDNGAGLAGDRAKVDGMGFRIMRYRAHAIGAVLRVDPIATGGTLVCCMLTII